MKTNIPISPGLQELSCNELQSTSGGNPIGWIFLLFVGELILHSLSDESCDAYWEGVEEGRNIVRNNLP